MPVVRRGREPEEHVTGTVVRRAQLESMFAYYQEPGSDHDVGRSQRHRATVTVPSNPEKRPEFLYRRSG